MSYFQISLIIGLSCIDIPTTEFWVARKYLRAQSYHILTGWGRNQSRRSVWLAESHSTIYVPCQAEKPNVELLQCLPSKELMQKGGDPLSSSPLHPFSYPDEVSSSLGSGAGCSCTHFSATALGIAGDRIRLLNILRYPFEFTYLDRTVQMPIRLVIQPGLIQ